jgi:putative ABC transport system substrate-binding protein
MKRREFITLLGGAAAGLPLTVHAQQKVHRIGVLLVGGPQFMGPYREALRDLGYVEGRNIQFEVRSAEGKHERLAELAAELVRSRVDIIVTSMTPAVAAAKNATLDIPIVMGAAGDPVANGLIANLARPGGNITGLSGAAAELASKSLELIREIVPKARRVGMLDNPNDPFGKTLREQIESGARTMRLVIQPIVFETGTGWPPPSPEWPASGRMQSSSQALCRCNRRSIWR